MIQVGDIVSFDNQCFELVKSEIRYSQFVFIGKSITTSRKYVFYMSSIQKFKLLIKKEITPCKLN